VKSLPLPGPALAASSAGSAVRAAVRKYGGFFVGAGCFGGVVFRPLALPQLAAMARETVT